MQGLAVMFLTVMLSLPVGAMSAGQAQTTAPDLLRQKRQELERTQRQLSRSQQQLDRHIVEEQSLLATLDAFSRRQEKLARALRMTTADLQVTQERAQTLQRTYTEWSRQVEQQRQHLTRRLRQLYKLGRHPYIKLVLSAKDVADFTYKAHYVRRFAAHDRQQLQRYHEGRARVAATQADLATTEQRIRAYGETLQQQRTALHDEQQRQTDLLRRIRHEKHLATQAIAEFAHTAKALSCMIDQLIAARAAAVRAPAVKGQLLWPVNGPVLASFGRVRHPHLDVYTVHKGMYIGAPLDSDVRVVAAGTVVYAGGFKGLGRLLIVDHGQHVLTLYGHVSTLRVQVGDHVHTQQIVATVGNSSTLGEPALYFAIRHHTAPQDPLLWLRQRSARLTEQP